MEQEHLRKLLSGDLQRIPRLPSKVVRIFLSSTFGDMTTERNFIVDELEPTLHQWCLIQGLEFQLVDMRWGVRDEATADHMTTILCLQEIAKCQELSLGPNFVFLLGQRYGYRPLPANIPSTEFEEILNSIEQAEQRQLIEEWYREDTNMVPSAHVLQPIGGIGDQEWQSVSTQLEGILRHAAEGLRKADKISFKEWQKYFTSVTEQEIRVALDVDNPNDHCLGFIREIVDLYDNLDDPSAKRFCDMTEGQADEKAKVLLDKFKLNYVPTVLGSSNIQKHQLRWTKDGIDIDSKVHRKYLQEINDHFLTWVKAQVTRARKRSENSDLAKDPLIAEVIHHANFCASKCASFCGCDETLQEIFGKIVIDKDSKPLVLHGISGSGKTSMVAMVAKQAKDIHGNNMNVVIRFLGTSSQSSSILHVLQSIVKHVCKLYDLPLPTFNILDNFNNLIIYMPSLLKSVSTHASQIPLLLVLDSLDQLEDSHRAYKCKWLPRKCPKGVQIVLSTLPDMFEILDRLKEIIVDDERFIPVKPLSEGTGADILDHWMLAIKRKVSDDQNEVIKKVFSKCPQPLFLKLLFEQARRWKSYDQVREDELAPTVRGAIGLLFERLERQFGQKLVSHALGYVTAARNGVTQDELQHMLSLDDEVLDELYQYWPPPDPKEVALPPLIWARLRFELQEYMVERQANGRTVMTLYHRQFTEAVRDRYLSTEARRKQCHQVMADFFSGKWAKTPKRLRITVSQNSMTLDPFRMVPQQPLTFQTDYNRRKLHELPFHLTLAGVDSLQEICSLVYGDFEFLDSYVKAFSAQSMIEEISATLKMVPEDHHLRSQLELLRDTIRLAKPTIEFEGSLQTLSAEILGRLLGLADSMGTEYDDCLKPLLRGAWEHCQKDPQPQLVPIRGSFPQPGGALRTTLVGHSGNINKIHVNKNCSMLASASEDGTVRIWDLSTDETIYILISEANHSILDVFISSDDRWIVGLSSDGAVHIWGMQTGDLLCTVPRSHLPSEHIGLLVTKDSKKIVCVTSSQIEVYNIHTGDLLYSTQPTNDVLTYTEMPSTTNVIYTGTQTGSLWVWSIEDGSSLSHLVPDDGASDLGAVAVMKSFLGGLVYVTENRFMIYVERGEDDHKEQYHVQKVFRFHSSRSCKLCLCVKRDGEQAWVACGSFVYCFNLRGDSEQPCYSLKGYCTEILSLVISNDEQYLIAGQVNDVMMVWLLNVMDPHPKALHPLEGLNADVSHLSYALVGQNQHMVISASTNLPFIKLWDLQKVSTDPTVNKTFFYKEGPLVLTSDSKYVVSLTSELSMEGEKSYVLNVWDSVSGKTQEACRSNFFAQCLAITGDDVHLFYSAEEDGVVCQYNLQSGEQVCCLKGGRGKVCHIEVRTDDKYLLVLKRHLDDTDSYFIELWHLQTRRHHAIKIDHQEGEIRCATLTEQNLVIMAGDHSSLLLCDGNGNQTKLKNGKYSQNRTGGVELLVMSDDEELLASKMSTQIIQIWSLKKRQILQTLDQVGNVRSMVFTRSGEFLITGASDRMIKVWSITEGSLYTSIYVYGNVVKLATNSDTIIATTENGHLMELSIHRGSNFKEKRRKSIHVRSRLCSVL